MIGLFRRESSGSQSCGDPAGSDPTLAGQLMSVEMQSVNRTPTPIGRAAADRRSASVCGVVTPIPEVSNGASGSGSICGTPTNGNDALIGLAGMRGTHHAGPFAVTASHRRNNRRSSLLELNG